MILRRCTAVDGAVSHTESESKSGVVYHTTAFSCTCPAFMYNASCKHIRELLDQTCTWMEHLSLTPLDQNDVEHCPLCGSRTSLYEPLLETR